MRVVAGVWLVTLAGCLSGSRGPAGPGDFADPVPATRIDPSAPGLARRPPTLQLDAPPMVAIPRSHPKVGTPMGKGSLSIGTPTTGFVVSCRMLPEEGPGHYVLPEHRQRRTRCATDDLVEALLRAADRVGRDHPGARLAVGNLGRDGGGDLPWSVSHNSGRDADLGFYLMDDAGRPYEARSLIPLDARGEGTEDGRPVRFDVPRNWALVKALLTDPTIQVQWLFLSNPLKKRLLAHARSRKERPDLVARAEEALAQPRRSGPHNDHLHLRISCPPDDVLEGCRDIGTARSWFRDPTPRIEARVRQLQTLARRGSPRVRSDALTVLGRIGTSEAVSTVLRGLGDPEVEVRRTAARSLFEGGIPEGEKEVVRHLRGEPDDEVCWTLIRALERHLNPWRRAAILPDLLDLDREVVRDLGLFRLTTSIRSEALEMAGRLPLALVPLQVRKAIAEEGVSKDQIAAIWRGADAGPKGSGDLKQDRRLQVLEESRDLRGVLLWWIRSWPPDPTAVTGPPVALPVPDPETAPSDAAAAD
ncbi:MAG TPA: penicillin-insensitive murein endopeptidase [Myxococcota bacterium]|nr:penicillin-insensitive murein endopeptidase [Myxococcota bacterium]HQK49793.1 penicillin-insensitive murein endopeptidase [Myxococcota bacterium]